MSKKRFYSFLGIGLFFLVLFIIWTILVYNGKLDSIDNKILEKIVDFRGEKYGGIYWLVRITTEFGFVFVIVGIIILALVLRKADLKCFFLGFGALFTYLSNMVVKLIVKRERPDIVYRWMDEISKSYPSSHTMCSTFVYGFIAYIFITSHLSKKIKIIISCLCFFIIPWVAFTRVTLAVHYFSDVVGGFIYGLVILFVGIAIYEKIRSKGYNGLRPKIEEKMSKKEL